MLGFECGGELTRGKIVMAWEHAGHCLVRAALCMLLFALYILLISIMVVTVRFVCCSIKLPLILTFFSAFFFPFSSPPQSGEGQ